jgi:hypothetical protein
VGGKCFNVDVLNFEGRTDQGAWDQDAEESVCTEERGSDRRMEKIAH